MSRVSYAAISTKAYIFVRVHHLHLNLSVNLAMDGMCKLLARLIFRKVDLRRAKFSLDASSLCRWTCCVASVYVLYCACHDDCKQCEWRVDSKSHQIVKPLMLMNDGVEVTLVCWHLMASDEIIYPATGGCKIDGELPNAEGDNII